MDKKIKELKDEIQSLKIKLGNTADFQEEIKIKKKIAELKTKIYDMILNSQKGNQYVTAYELLQRKQRPPTFWETGFKFIDRAGGIPKGAFIQFGASSEAGKTTLTIALALRLSSYKKVCHFNFEMNENLLAKKIKMFLPNETQLNNYRIDSVSNDLEDLKREIMLHIQDGVEFFIIDSRMKIKAQGNSRAEKASLISNELARICQINEVTIILINQLSEESQKTGLPNLKESGDQIYDADMVWFLLKPIAKKPKGGEMVEFDNSYRRFIMFKNRYDEDGSGHYTTDVPKEEVIPQSQFTTAKEIEPQVDMPQI